MQRKPSGKFDKKAYDMEYREKNIKRRLIPFNMSKQEDRILWDWLEKVDNITEYIKRLIRDDMGKS